MRSFALAHPFIALFLGLFTLGLLAAFWPVFLTLAILAGLGYAAYHVSTSHDRLALHKATMRAQLKSRADQQHAATLAGHPYGLYGIYPPAC